MDTACIVPAMHVAASTGRVVAGRYYLQDPIGRGAMGTVWRARDAVLARDVAVKEVLRGGPAARPRTPGSAMNARCAKPGPPPG